MWAKTAHACFREIDDENPLTSYLLYNYKVFNWSPIKSNLAWLSRGGYGNPSILSHGNKVGLFGGYFQQSDQRMPSGQAVVLIFSPVFQSINLHKTMTFYLSLLSRLLSR